MLPYAIAITTPKKTTKQPRTLIKDMFLFKNKIFIITVNGAAKENKILFLLGPIFCNAINKKVSPKKIPITYVPARNMIFLSTALAWAEVLNARVIFFGANKQDYVNYPDCRPDFFSAFEKTASLATRIGDDGQRIVVDTPLIHNNKSEIIGLGLKLNVNYALTWSCYNPQGDAPCLLCDACMMRQQGFAGLDMIDPLLA